MVYDEEENLETPREGAGAGGMSSARAAVIGAFAAGVLAGVAVTIGVLVFSRVTIGGRKIGDGRPRRLLIGNLEIEERGNDARFHVQ